jgi:hypothetical protein
MDETVRGHAPVFPLQPDLPEEIAGMEAAGKPRLTLTRRLPTSPLKP